MTVPYPHLADIHVELIDGEVAEPEGLEDVYRRWFDEIAPEGWLSATAGVSDDGRFLAMHRFPSAESARRMDDEARRSWRSDLSQHLDEVQVHEASHVATFGQARPDEAGSVVVVQAEARVTRDVLERIAQDELHAMRRRDLVALGGLLAHHGDGRFTELIYYPPGAQTFGEHRDSPLAEEGASMLEQLAEHVSGLDYRNIPEPWIARP